MMDLTKCHSRLLLKYLANARACGGFYSPCDSSGPGWTVEQLKAELATREHVMNKREAKAYRQKRAKEKR